MKREANAEKGSEDSYSFESDSSSEEESKANDDKKSSGSTNLKKKITYQVEIADLD
eukprot:CAMPEP_0170508610 /NCGR_PEP_ID=MMETSP0208-20121228/62902_1 /TAXON_ID=197538 /ORGANISM="Strombidium inclinatum, Strain S3" /LENGTH=55 /DNA_ID=CAMNT_0010791615 /DNA_START=57 /DNA_END=224 /DNA_ORIENTATION=-